MTWLERYRARHYIENSIWILPRSASWRRSVRSASPRDRGGAGLEIGHQPGNGAGGAGNHGLVDVHVHRLRLFRAAGGGATRQRPTHATHHRHRLQGPGTKFSLTVFVFTFTFSLAVLVRINTSVPLLTARLAAYSCLASLGVFLYLIDHVGKSLRPSGALRAVALLGAK